MAIAKVILNGETLMDVTSDTATANNMLSGIKATKNDGTKVTGNIASKSSTDLSVSGATVTAPAGYYANAASKAVATATHPSPTASITSSTGVVTASHTQGTGYVTSGTTTGTLSLTTQAGKTVTPTEAAQTAVASYRWTTGPVSVAAISSTYVGTGVAKKSAADLTASGSVVTAPVGYYSSAVSKAVAAGSAFPPAVTITKAPTIGVNTSGVVTASYNGSSSITPTVNAGYISQGTAGTISTTGTSTYQLTSKAAATYYPSTTDQTIASQRWLVGAQTIKSVTTSNLTAENIAEGVVVKVGDTNNASRITQVTGTHRGGTKHTAIITKAGWWDDMQYLGCYVSLNGSGRYYQLNQTIEFSAGDTLEVHIILYNSGNITIKINGEVVVNNNTNKLTYNYTLPDNDINIDLDSAGNYSLVEITTSTGSSYTPISVGTIEVTANVTSTTAVEVTRSTIDTSALSSSKMIYVKIRDKAGKRNGYFWGTDTFFLMWRSSDGTTYYNPAKQTYRINSSGGTVAYTPSSSNQYGIYIQNIGGDGTVVVYGRYNSSYTLTIDGTYSVDIYMLEWPDNISPIV